MNNTARQKLMNDLGLTREVIREEMYNIIHEEIQKELKKPEFVNLLADALLGPKRNSNLRWDILNLSSSRITSQILKKFGDFLVQEGKKDSPLTENNDA